MGEQPGDGSREQPAPAPALRASELVPAAVDALLPLLAAVAVVVIGLLLVIAVGLSGVHLQNAGFADYLSVSSWLTASSLGVPLGGVTTDTAGLESWSLGGADFATTLTLTLRFGVLLVTALILFLDFRAARRRERAVPSSSLGRLVARAAMPAVVSVLALLVLALSTRRTPPFGTQAFFADDPLAGTGDGTLGIDTPYVFLGPLLLVLAAALLGRLSIWIYASSTTDVIALRLRAQAAVWAPAWHTVWLQLRVIGGLAGFGLWIYVIFEAPSDPSTNSHPLAAVFAALLLILNLSVYGTFAGFGATLYLSLNGGDGTSLGLLDGTRPWGLWLLLLAVLLGTAAPAILARRTGTRRFAVRAHDCPPAGAWRAAALGVAAALVLVLLGTLELDASVAGDQGLGGFGAVERFAPSLSAALGLTALWCAAGYLALSFSQGHRLAVSHSRGPQSGQSEQFGQQYPQAYQQSHPGVPEQPGRGDVLFPDEGETIGSAQPTVFLPPPPPLAVSGDAGEGASSVTVPLVPHAGGESVTEPLTPGAPGTPSTTQSFATQPITTQPSSTQPFPTLPTPTTPLPARFGGRRLGIALLALVVLAAGGFTAYHFLAGSSLPGPEAAVTAYFRDLASGDARDAAALATGPYQATPVIGTQTLADPAKRPSALEIVSSELLTASEVEEYGSAGATGRNLTYVAVKYTVHGARLDDVFIAAQDASTSAWKLIDPYRVVQVGGGWSDTLTVDGQTVAGNEDLELFPGAHVIADPASRDFAAESVTVYPAGPGGTGAARSTFGAVTLPDPQLSGTGRSAAQNAYRDALNACAAQAATGYGVCGIDDTYDGYTCNSVTWTITGVAQVQVDLGSASGDGGFEVSASGSTATESGDYTDWTGTDQTFRNQSADLEDSYGTLVFHPDGSATITLEN